MANIIEVDTYLINNSQYYSNSVIPIYSRKLIDRIKDGKSPGFVSVRPALDGTYEAISNYYLLHALRQANAPYSPVVIVDNLTEDEVKDSLKIETGKENVNVIDLAERYASEANQASNGRYQRKSIAFLQAKYGKSQSYISNVLRLLSLPKFVQELIREEKLSSSYGRTLLLVLNRLKEKHHTNNINDSLVLKDLRNVIQWIISENPSIKKIENKYRKNNKKQNINTEHFSSSKPNTNTQLKDPNVIKLENELTELIGANVTISNTRIEIDCFNYDIMDGVLAKMGYTPY